MATNCSSAVKQGSKAFQVIPKPMKSVKNIEDRLWLCNYLRHWSESDFMHLAPRDEFFVWTVRRSNYQNHRIWSLSSEDVPNDESYQELATKPSGIGIFICFTAVKLIWVTTNDDAPWDGTYYRQSILLEKCHSISY